MGCLGIKIKFHLSPLCFLVITSLKKYNQIWGVSYSHAWGVQQQKYIWPWEGVKWSNNFNNKVNFKDFYTKFWCVFSQMKDTKHIRRIFFLSPGSCPRGVTRGCLGGKN